MPDVKEKIYFIKRQQEEKHTQELANKLKLPYICLAGYPFTDEIMSIIPEENCLQYFVIPYLKIGKTVKVGAVAPNDPKLKQFLMDYGKTIGVTFNITVISKTSFIYGIANYENSRKKKLEEKAKTQAKGGNVGYKISDLRSAADALKKANTTELFDLITVGAAKTLSSDIHIEPGENSFLIRYRIDGILQDVVSLPLIQYKQLVSRIKYLAKLRMDIFDQPQDGRITVKNEGDDLDLRVSIMPSTWGESITIRLLGLEKSILKLDNLGIRPDALAAIKEAITKPYGMILTSGPTGSGKTSTLYAILMELKKPGVKIITLENPVEYRIEGLEQSQVKPGAGYEFADGLKASLRQDPDILMVGEIRDEVTAETAVQAALTGHLLISTVHANSAPAVFARLIEIGIKPFLLSGSVNLIMAQRLVRKICPDCIEKYTPQPEVWQEVQKTLLPIKTRLNPNLQKIIDSPSPQLLKGKGCETCGRTGFTKRIPLIEVLVPNEKIEGLISKKATISEFEKTAAAEGMITMEQDGLMRVLQGITTIEEVWRVTRS